MLIFLEKGMIFLVSLIFFNITSQPTGIWNKNLQQFNHSQQSNASIFENFADLMVLRRGDFCKIHFAIIFIVVALDKHDNLERKTECS